MVLIWKYSVRAFQWIPTWQGLDGFQKSLRPCPLEESSLSIGRVNAHWGHKEPDNFDKIFYKILLWKHFEGNMSFRTMPKILSFKYFEKSNSKVIVISILDPDNYFYRNSSALMV